MQTIKSGFNAIKAMQQIKKEEFFDVNCRDCGRQWITSRSEKGSSLEKCPYCFSENIRAKRKE